MMGRGFFPAGKGEILWQMDQENQSNKITPFCALSPVCAARKTIESACFQKSCCRCCSPLLLKKSPKALLFCLQILQSFLVSFGHQVAAAAAAQSMSHLLRLD